MTLLAGSRVSLLCPLIYLFYLSSGFSLQLRGSLSPFLFSHFKPEVPCVQNIYLRPKVTLHFSVPNISTLILILSKLNIAMSFQHMP